MATAYLWRRGSTWWYRRAYPTALLKYIRKSDLRVSLRTKDFRAAKTMCSKITCAFDDWTEVCRQAVAINPDNPEIPILELMLEEQENLTESVEKIADLRVKSSEFRHSIELARLINTQTEQLDRIGKHLTPLTQRVQQLKNAPAPSIRTQIKEELAFQLAEMKTMLKSAHLERWSSEPLSAFAVDFIKHKKKNLDDSKHSSAYEPKINYFISTIGDKPVRDYVREDLEEFRDLLDCTPTRWTERFKTNDIKTAIAKNKMRRTPFPPISPTTVDESYLTIIKTFFSWLVEK